MFECHLHILIDAHQCKHHSDIEQNKCVVRKTVFTCALHTSGRSGTQALQCLAVDSRVLSLDSTQESWTRARLSIEYTGRRIWAKPQIHCWPGQGDRRAGINHESTRRVHKRYYCSDRLLQAVTYTFTLACEPTLHRCQYKLMSMTRLDTHESSRA